MQFAVILAMIDPVCPSDLECHLLRFCVVPFSIFQVTADEQ